MRTYSSSLLLLLMGFLLITSCTTNMDEDDPNPQPEVSQLITGSYTFTTYENGQVSGSGTAIIERTGSNRIRIGLEDGVSFYAQNLQQLNDNIVMEVPSQSVDYYGMSAIFAGSAQVATANTRYEGVYFGQSGRLEMSLIVTVNNQAEPIELVLER